MRCGFLTRLRVFLGKREIGDARGGDDDAFWGNVELSLYFTGDKARICVDPSPFFYRAPDKHWVEQNGFRAHFWEAPGSKVMHCDNAGGLSGWGDDEVRAVDEVDLSCPVFDHGALRVSPKEMQGACCHRVVCGDCSLGEFFFEFPLPTPAHRVGSQFNRVGSCLCRGKRRKSIDESVNVPTYACAIADQGRGVERNSERHLATLAFFPRGFCRRLSLGKFWFCFRKTEMPKRLRNFASGKIHGGGQDSRKGVLFGCCADGQITIVLALGFALGKRQI